MLALVHSLSLGAPTGDAPETRLSPAVLAQSGALSSLYEFKAGNKVLYAISTCEAYHATRALGVFNTWCKDIESCVFYSDHETDVAPATIKIEIEADPGKGDDLDGLRRAQMRYIRILRHASSMIIRNLDGRFGSTKWAVVCDDDTYVFHHNMVTYLTSLNHDKAIYTGHTLVASAYPVDSDGEGHTLVKAIKTPFACGGGGSVFSIGAMKKMYNNIADCVANSLPGHYMWQWQSDWMMGECAHNSQVELLNQPADRFGQFLYKNTTAQGKPPDHLLVTDPEKTKFFCELNHGRCARPLSIHPVKEVQGSRAIFEHLPHSSNSEVYKIKPMLHLDGTITFE